MRRFKRISWTSAVVAMLLLVAAAISGNFVISRQEAQSKQPVVNFLQGVAPITAASFDLEKGTMAFGKRFRGSSEWFRYLSVNLENPTDKIVTYVSISVTFIPPKGTANLLPFRFAINKGNKDQALRREDSGFLMENIKRPDGSRKTYNVRPDDPDREYELNRTSLDGIGFPPIVEEIQLQIEEVVFSDGTIWLSGRWYRSDPANPDKLIEVSKGSDEEVAASS